MKTIRLWDFYSRKKWNLDLNKQGFVEKLILKMALKMRLFDKRADNLGRSNKYNDKFWKIDDLWAFSMDILLEYWFIK